jgi:hypothetical protein
MAHLHLYNMGCKSEVHYFPLNLVFQQRYRRLPSSFFDFLPEFDTRFHLMNNKYRPMNMIEYDSLSKIILFIYQALP